MEASGKADAASMRTVLEEFEGPLLRYAARLTGSADLAREVVQDVFLKLTREGGAEPNGRLPQWLYAVCRNRAIDVRRKEQRMSTIDITEAPVARCNDPAARLECRDEASKASAILATLPVNQQEVVRLRFEHGLSYKQIAEVTGLSVSNVGFLIHTAFKTVRERMKATEG